MAKALAIMLCIYDIRAWHFNLNYQIHLLAFITPPPMMWCYDNSCIYLWLDHYSVGLRLDLTIPHPHCVIYSKMHDFGIFRSFNWRITVAQAWFMAILIHCWRNRDFDMKMIYQHNLSHSHNLAIIL